MNPELKVKVEEKQGEDQKTDQKTERKTVTYPIVGLPIEVHEKIIDYKRKMIGERRQDFTLNDAYIEILTRATQLL